MWTAGSVWIAPFEGTRWRSYGFDSTDSQKSRLGLVVSMAIPGRERWLRKSARNGGVESLEIGEKRSFCSRRHTWSGRAGARRVFDIPRVRSGAVKDDLQLGCGESFDDGHRTSAGGDSAMLSHKFSPQARALRQRRAVRGTAPATPCVGGG